MQIYEEDYYAETEYNEGCCLKCSDKEEGCLCYFCKCTKCYWYITPEEYNFEKGKCGKVSHLKQQKKEEWIKKYSENIKKQKLENNKGQSELNDFNDKK